MSTITINQEIRNTKSAHAQMKAAEATKFAKDIAVGRKLIQLKTNGFFKTYKSPKGLVYPTWPLFVKGVFGWSISYANKFINAAQQQDRLAKILKVTVVNQPIDTLWTCRRIEDKRLKAAWAVASEGDTEKIIYDDELHKHVCMHESVKERDARDRRVTTRMIESEFIELVDAVNDRIAIVNKKIAKKKGCTLQPEPTYSFDATRRVVVDQYGAAFEVNEWLSRVANYLRETNRL